MAFTIDIGDGKTVVINEPRREQFSSNLIGALGFLFTHTFYKILEFFGNSLSRFVIGFGVGFLETIEPHLIEYIQPLYKYIEESEDLPEEVREFFDRLVSGKHEAGALVLSGITSAAGSAVTGSVLDILTKPIAYIANYKIRPSIPAVDALIAMYRRKVITEFDFLKLMRSLGFKDNLIQAFLSITEQVPSISELIQALWRGAITQSEFLEKLEVLGIPTETANVLIANSESLLSVGDVINAYYRNELTKSEYLAYMAKLGYQNETANFLIEKLRPLPPLQDVQRMAVREAWNDGVARKWRYDDDLPQEFIDAVKKLGYDENWARYYWRAHWELPSLTLATEMVHRGIINDDEYDELLRIADYPREWRQRIKEVIYTPFTRVDVRRMYRLGVLSYEDMIRAYMDIGYSREKAERLAEFTEKYEAPDSESKPEQQKELTRSLIERAYRDRIITREEAVRQLSELKYNIEDINFILDYVDAKTEFEERPDYRTQYRKDIMSILEKSYSKRMIDSDTFAHNLQALGLTAEEVNLLTSTINFAVAESERDQIINLIKDAYISNAISKIEAVSMLGHLNLPASQLDSLLRVWDINLSIRSRRLTEAQYRSALNRGIITIEEYREALEGLGYSDKDIDILLKMYTQ